jgi:muconolactone delta-isomerase
MQFAVLSRAVDNSNLPPQVAVKLAHDTFELLASGRERRITAAYPFAGQRAGLLIVDVNSGEELQDLIGSLPFAPIVTTEIHPIGTVQGALKTTEQAQRRIAEMASAMAPAGH